MEQYFQELDEACIKKFYPKGYFAAVVAGQKSAGIFIYVFFSIMLLFFAPVTFFGFWFAISCYQDGFTVVPGLFVGGTGLIMIVVAIFMFRLARKRSGRSAEDWLKKSAEGSCYPESVIREFEQQVLTPGSYLLRIAGKRKAKSAFGTGILTKDYVYFDNRDLCIMKISDIKWAYFMYLEDTVGTGKYMKTVNILYFVLDSVKGTTVGNQVKKEAGEMLMAMLKEQNPDIDTKDGKIFTVEEAKAFH